MFCGLCCGGVSGFAGLGGVGVHARCLHHLCRQASGLPHGCWQAGILHYFVDGFAIGLGDGGDVFWGFESAFDFEAADAEGDELGDFIDGGEVLWREQVTFVAEVAEFAIDDHLIGHTAGLGALAAVGAAATERFGGEALAGVGDTESTVDEDFEREFWVIGGVEALKFTEGELAGEHGLVDA